MSISNLADSAGWKTFSAKVYHWARALVVLGIIFLINHWPGGAIITSIGGGLLILIFIVVAFESPREEYDWTLAFPQLAGMVKADDSTLEADRIAHLRTEIERLKEDIDRR